MVTTPPPGPVSCGTGSAMMDAMFLGEDLLAYLALALGGALFAGNLIAVIKPPDRQRDEGNLDRAPVARSLMYAGLGLVVAVWALATLVAG